VRRLLLARVAGCDLGRFARLERALLASAPPGGEGEPPAPVLLLAELEGDGVLLGGHQRARSAIHLASARAAGLAVARRAGGGPAVAAGGGTLGVLLWAPPGSGALPPGTPVDRAPNRLVRGLLAGLRAAGARDAAFFGRDFVSSQGRRVAAVSQEGTEEGGVALEALVAASRPLALPPGLARYPAHADPRAGGPPDGTVEALAAAARDAAAVADAVARGWAEALGAELEPAPPGWAEAAAAGPGAAETPPVEEDETGLSESGLAEVPIGFVEALVRVEGNRLREARLRGDFQAPAHARARLERSLAGAPPTFAEVGRRVDEAFGRPGAFLRGLDARRTLADAVLAAAAG
jgi:hypothetical protein